MGEAGGHDERGWRSRLLVGAVGDGDALGFQAGEVGVSSFIPGR